MALIGLVSVVPMIGYDFTLNNILEQRPKKLYIFETSWLVNTLNNIAGFGGFVSAGLRSEFYGKQTSGKKVIQALSKILVFTMSGLSIYALLSFFLVMFDDHNQYLRQYWIWLIGGGLYFPIVFCLSLFGKGRISGRPEKFTSFGIDRDLLSRVDGDVSQFHFNWFVDGYPCEYSRCCSVIYCCD